MRKLGIALLTAGLLSLTLSFPAFAGVSAGSTCKKMGTVTFVGWTKFTCVKKGKKLVWSKPVQLSVPVTTASPTSSPISNTAFSAWSENFTLEAMVRATVDGYVSWIRQLPTLDVPHYRFFQPELPTVWRDLFTKVDPVVASTLDRYINRPTYSFFALDCPWMRTQVDAYSAAEIRKTYSRCDTPLPGEPGYGLNSYNAAGFVSEGLTSPSADRLFQTAGDFAHEYMHNVQNQLMGGTGYHYEVSPAPRWLLEGSAVFFGNAIACQALSADCLSMERVAFRGTRELYALSNALIDYELKIVQRPDPNYLPPYAIGYRAVEYIVASTSPQAIIDIFRYLGSGMTFAEAFAKSTGLSLDDFYAKFERVRDRLQIAPVTMRLINGVNTPVG